MNSQSKINQLAVAGGILLLKNLKGDDAGVYKCSAVNILGQAHAVGHLVVNGEFMDTTSTSTSTLFHKTIGYNRLARKIAIANLGGPVKRKIN